VLTADSRRSNTQTDGNQDDHRVTDILSQEC